MQDDLVREVFMYVRVDLRIPRITSEAIAKAIESPNSTATSAEVTSWVRQLVNTELKRIEDELGYANDGTHTPDNRAGNRVRGMR